MRETVQLQKQTANEETNVKDISRGVIYTKDGYLIKIMRLYAINIELLSDSEKETMCNILTGEFKGEANPFSILCIPRTVDMEAYIASITQKYEEEIFNVHRKMLLAEMINEAAKKVLSGSNFEHQFYLMIWERADSSKNQGQLEKLLEERMHVFENRYQAVRTLTKILGDTELLRLCNLFANSNTALFESIEGDEYKAVPWMRKDGSK